MKTKERFYDTLKNRKDFLNIFSHDLFESPYFCQKEPNVLLNEKEEFRPRFIEFTSGFEKGEDDDKSFNQAIDEILAQRKYELNDLLRTSKKNGGKNEFCYSFVKSDSDDFKAGFYFESKGDQCKVSIKAAQFILDSPLYFGVK